MSQEPMDVIWAGELVNVPYGEESQNSAQPPEADVIILDPQSRPPQAVTVEPGVTRAGNGLQIQHGQSGGLYVCIVSEIGVIFGNYYYHGYLLVTLIILESICQLFACVHPINLN